MRNTLGIVLLVAGLACCSIGEPDYERSEMFELSVPGRAVSTDATFRLRVMLPTMVYARTDSETVPLYDDDTEKIKIHHIDVVPAGAVERLGPVAEDFVRYQDVEYRALESGTASIRVHVEVDDGSHIFNETTVEIREPAQVTVSDPCQVESGEVLPRLVQQERALSVDMRVEDAEGEILYGRDLGYVEARVDGEPAPSKASVNAHRSTFDVDEPAEMSLSSNQFGVEHRFRAYAPADIQRIEVSEMRGEPKGTFSVRPDLFVDDMPVCRREGDSISILGEVSSPDVCEFWPEQGEVDGDDRSFDPHRLEASRWFDVWAREEGECRIAFEYADAAGDVRGVFRQEVTP